MTLLIPQDVVQRMRAQEAGRTEVCGNCRHRFEVKTPNGPSIECRAHPPTASLNMVPVQSGVAVRGQQGMALQPFSLWPPINDDYFCDEWAARPEAVS